MTDYFTAVYQQLVTLVGANADLIGPLVKANNFVHYLRNDISPASLRQWLTADFPSLFLEQTSGDDAQYSQDATFAVENASFMPGTAELAEPMKQVFTFSIYGPDLRIAPVNAIKSQILFTLRQAGPRLGLPYCLTDKVTWRHGLATGREQRAGSSQRQVCQIQLPVTLTLEPGETLS